MHAVWAMHGALRRGIGQREAADLPWTLTSPEIYRLLVSCLGWAPEAYEAWLTAAIERELFGG